METNRIGSLVLMLSLAMLTVACGTLELEPENARDEPGQLTDSTGLPTEEKSSMDIEPTTTEEGTSADSATQRYVFEELGISLEVPADLYVKKDPLVKLDDPSKLGGYLFYIQNYGHPGGQSSGDFQMYGHLQYGSYMTLSWDAFSENTVNSPMNASANFIEIDGLRGYDTQLSGVRNRFVYLFHLDQHVLSIAVSAPTPENKALADQIISTLKVLPGGLSDASDVKLVSDPNLLYQILIPDDWETSFQPTIGLQLSSLEATSPDLEVLIEDVGGPHSNIYYKNGVHMHIQVLGDDTESYEPYPGLVKSQYDVYFNGIVGTEYVFVEPSTTEGELRSVRVAYDGKSYLLRFGYADDAYRDDIDRIIASLQITPETFYLPQ